MTHAPIIRLAYGPGPHHVGDLHRCSGTPRAVVVVVHGGFWRAHRTLDMTSAAAAALTRHGFAVWNVEYRRAGQGSWVDTLSDVGAAVDHLPELAHDHGLDQAPVLLFGHSAGGQLAAWCAGRQAVAARTGRQPPAVRIAGLVTAGAALDLRTAARDGVGDGAVAGFLGGQPDEVPARFAEADPALRLPLGVPARCLHSDHDERVPSTQSWSWVQRARAAGDDAELVHASGAHTAAIEPGSPDFTLTAEALDRLV